MADLVLTERVSYRLRRPRRWELIAYRRSDGQVIIRRAVGLPGEAVQLTDKGRVLIDGRPVDRPPRLDSIQYLPVCNVQSGKKEYFDTFASLQVFLVSVTGVPGPDESLAGAPVPAPSARKSPGIETRKSK